MKELHQLLRDRRVLGQRLLDVLLAEGKPGLLQIFCIRTQQQYFIACQRSGQGKTIEAVVFDLVFPDTRKGRFKFRLNAIKIQLRKTVRKTEIMNMQRRKIVSGDHI